ncbi:uncharacterized protein TrAtP1_010761 [Trichoderma atroviride]|nr:hypothetical protein TrAtP1_010761 [Trichoderma atroviride]
MTLVSELAAPPLGSLIMIKSSPLMTMVVATMVEFLSIFVLPFISEASQHAAAEYETLSGDEPSDEAVALPVPDQLLSSRKTLSTRIKEKTKAITEGMGEAAKFAVKDRNILFALPSFLLPIIAQELMAFLLQYTSTKFGWTLAAATILTTMRPAITILLYTLLLPTFNRFLLMRLGLSAGNADLVAAKVSPVLSVLGLLMMGLSSTPWMLAIGLVVFTLGYGYTQSAQLFLASRVEKDQLGLLYTVTATISAIGGILGAPLIAQTLNLGLKLSGIWLGLPFFVAAGVYALSSIGVWSLSFT